MKEELWHILDAGTVLMEEFAAEFTQVKAAVAWVPEMLLFGAFADWERAGTVADPPLSVMRFPLQRGYARKAVRSIFPFEDKLIKRMLRHAHDASRAPVICSTPHYAPLAEKWPGPVVYHSTDLTSAYSNVDRDEIVALDRRMCRAARVVCPNSQQIARYFVRDAGCDPAKIVIIPNATRESNLVSEPLLAPGPLPADIAHVRRPIAGLLGNLANNMDWTLVAEVIRKTPELSWVFVGPTSMKINSEEQTAARAWSVSQAHCTGNKPYGELQAYARCFDVAVLPYIRKEPTYSGSSTRFYQHLAACRPMVATRGFAELLEKEPLLTLVDTAQEMEEALRNLRERGFQDGLEVARWEASLRGTWKERARSMVATLA